MLGWQEREKKTFWINKMWSQAKRKIEAFNLGGQFLVKNQEKGEI